MFVVTVVSWTARCCPLADTDHHRSCPKCGRHVFRQEDPGARAHLAARVAASVRRLGDVFSCIAVVIVNEVVDHVEIHRNRSGCARPGRSLSFRSVPIVLINIATQPIPSHFSSCFLPSPALSYLVFIRTRVLPVSVHQIVGLPRPCDIRIQVVRTLGTNMCVRIPGSIYRR